MIYSNVFFNHEIKRFDIALFVSGYNTLLSNGLHEDGLIVTLSAGAWPVDECTQLTISQARKIKDIHGDYPDVFRNPTLEQISEIFKA